MIRLFHAETEPSEGSHAMLTTANSTLTSTPRELTIQDLDTVVGGMRKSAGSATSGVMFLTFQFAVVPTK